MVRLLAVVYGRVSVEAGGLHGRDLLGGGATALIMAARSALLPGLAVDAINCLPGPGSMALLKDALMLLAVGDEEARALESVVALVALAPNIRAFAIKGLLGRGLGAATIIIACCIAPGGSLVEAHRGLGLLLIAALEELLRWLLVPRLLLLKICLLFKSLVLSLLILDNCPSRMI